MEIITAIVSKVGEYLVEPTINQARYLFRFNKIVEDLMEAERNLKSKQGDVEKEIEAATRNDERIKATVQDWLSDSRKIMVEVETLKGKIEVNKTCLNGWCPNWVSRHQLGRKATKTSIRLNKVIVDGGRFDRVGNLAPLSGEPSAPKDFDFFQHTTDAFDKIMEALKNDGIHMVILYGMGGVGKTTLAKAVSKKVKEEGIFKEVVMATVSQTPNFINIQGKLAELLNLQFKEETEEGRAKRLLSRFSESNNNLIILDDIWEEFNFEEKIGVPSSKGCKMLLTTRYRNVCTYREYQSLIHLDVLKEHEGVALLKKEVGIDDDCVNLNTLATRIARECGGLPLALVTTGRYLRGKKDIEIWESVCEKLKKSKLEDLGLVNSTERGVYASLKLSYDYLKGDKIRLCFLMCSLFPEDFEIPLEDLVRIGVGLDLYEGVSSIEEARRDLRLIVEELKALGLLLDAYEKEFVRMHDIVRDVCLWITSKGENIFMSKSGMDLTQLTREKGWKQYTAISLLENKLEELSVRLVCPKLKLLLLGGENQWLHLKVSNECFEEMKALEVVSLRYADLSVKSLQFLTNLKTLELFGCNLRDISFLAKLNKLEILSFRGSRFDELPIELSELKELRMLDLRGCLELERIPSNLIRSFSQLEELYMEDIFEKWEVEEKSTETSNARLSEVNYLPWLAVLYLKINSKCLPKDFAFSELSRYEIGVNLSIDGYKSSKSSKALIIFDIDATLLTALFKALYHSVEYLGLKRVTGCQNILPSIDQKGLKKLNTLEVRHCEDLKCMIDASQVGEENPKLHPSLAKLKLRELPELQCIWKGPMSIIVNFQSLTDVYVRECKSLAYLFTLSIARSLGQLKSLRVEYCESLEFLIKIEEGDNGRGEKMLSKLEDLRIRRCSRLEYVFPVFVAAGLIQLKNLEIGNAAELKQVFHGKEENEVAEEGKDIKLPNLKKLNLYKLKKLTRFFPENNHSTPPALEKLRELSVSNCNDQFVDKVLSGLRPGFFKNLEELHIGYCGAKVVFQLEDLISERQQHELSLPKLKSLSLYNLKELEGLWKGPAHVLRLENLTTFTISGCKKLKRIFSFTLVESLGQLESLLIQDCENLEQVFYLDENVGSRDEKNINLPKLKKINLEAVTNLKSFCPEKYHLTCPVLEEFRINAPVRHFGKKERRIVVMDYCSIQLCDEILFELRCGFLKKFEGLSMTTCGVKEVFQLEGQQHELSLPKLKSLELECLEELEGLCKGPAHVLMLENLTTLSISDCKKLKHIFSFTLVQRLGQLEKLLVWDCENLEQVFYLDHEREEYVGGGGQKDIVLPKLKKLHLEGLAKLVSFFPEKYAACCPALEEFTVKDCSKLTTTFIVEELQNLQFVRMSNCSSQLWDGILSGLRCGFFKKIKELSMENCGVLAHELSFSNLKNLTFLAITHFNKLKRIFSPIVARNHMLQLKRLHIRECAELEQIIDVKDGEEVGANLLQTLSYIEVEKCHKLKYLFPISIARGFQQLKRLEVIDNSELEQMVDVKDGEEVGASLLPTLSFIRVEKCHKLKNLFPISIARGFQQLQRVEVWDNSQLEEIFGDNDVIDEKEIQLPQLERIYLGDLPRLTNFCHVDYHFIFPAPPLLELKVKRCPKISTRFSWDEENKSVHAEAKAPKIRSTEDESHQEQAPKIGSQEDSHQEQAPERGSEDEIHEEQASEMGSEDDSHEEQAPERGSEDEIHEEQASEMGSEDDSHEEQASEMGSEDDSHEETSTDLCCFDDDFEELPRYIKNKELYSDSRPTE